MHTDRSFFEVITPNQLEDVWEQVRGDQPWGDRVRVLVGPHGSRTVIKEWLLERVPGVASGSVTGVEEFAREILMRAGAPLAVPLSRAAQIDALEVISKDPNFRAGDSKLARALRTRSIAKRLAAYVTRFDYAWSDLQQLEATLEAVSEREGQRFESQKKLLEALVLLWKRGVFWPWSGAELLRQASERVLEAFGEPAKHNSPIEVYLWGFCEWTEVEQAFFRRLSESENIRVHQVLPSQGKSGVSYLWRPHSEFDELENLTDELLKLRDEGGTLKSTAVIAPKKNIGRRRLLEHLHRAGVAAREVSPTESWRQSASAHRWRNVWHALAGQSSIDLVLPLLDRRAKTHGLLTKSLASGQVKGQRALKKLFEETSDERLRTMVALSRSLARAVTPLELQRILIENDQARKTEDVFLDYSIAHQFAEYLVNERPLLAGQRIRPPKIKNLFDEFLEHWGRRQILRYTDAVWIYDPGAWLDLKFKKVFVLSADQVFDSKSKRPSADPWSVEAAQGRLSSEISVPSEELWAKRQIEVEAIGRRSLEKADAVVFSVCGGTDRQAIAETLCPDAQESGVPVVHVRSGWTTIGARPTFKTVPVRLGEAYECVDRERAVGFLESGKIRVTAFEDYVKCPRLFYERHVRKNEPLQALSLEVDPRVRGDSLHSVLETLTKKKMRAQVEFASLTNATIKDLVAHTVREKTKNRTRSRQFAHPSLALPLIDELTDRVSAWVRREVEMETITPALTPKLVEHRFELLLDERSPIRLIGTMDRLDTAGSHAVIIDYKTGVPRFSGKDLKAGYGVQLVAYASAVEEQGLVPVASLYLVVQRFESKVAGGLLCKPYNKKYFRVGPTSSGLVEADDLSETLKNARRKWPEYLEALQNGNFTADPLDPAVECRTCAYRLICGFKEKTNSGTQS